MTAQRPAPLGGEGDDENGADGAAVERLSQEDVFQTLSNERRRYVIHYLLQHGRTEIRELSLQVAAWENDKPREQVTSDERRSVYNALQQSHLPKMAGSGVIEYDAARGVVEPTADLDDLEVYLEIVPGHEIPWSQYYLLLGLFCSSLTAAVWLEAPPFGWVPPMGLAAVCVALFTASAVVHSYHASQMRLGNDGPPPGV
ncbi:hypothetical protein ACFQH6_05940 [Halobacteriaceae archaeon GCM10025711]